MIYLSQNDKRWAGIPLGPLTIGRIGCLVTCISMLTDYFKEFKTPPELAKIFKFTPGGLLIWSSLKSPLKLEKRIYSKNNYEIDTSLKNPIKAVALNINSGAHWVLALKKWFFNTYLVLDPWTGKKRIVKPIEIVGSAHFIKN